MSQIYKHTILALLLFTSSAFAEPPVDPDFDAKYEAWNILCETQTEYSCYGIKPPIVKLVSNRDYRGYYNGGNVIFFSTFYYDNFDKEPKIHKLITLVHESAHYLQKEYGVVPFSSQVALCDSENFAFTVANNWLRQQGREDLVMVDWWRPRDGYRGYWKCFTWYGPTGGYVISEPGFTKGPASD
jgi:hypothetical protein